jgi:hypothetical protein
MSRFGGNPFFSAGTFGGHCQSSMASNLGDLSSALESPVQRNDCRRNAHYPSSSLTSGESSI